MSCAQWTLAWPKPRATPQPAPGAEQSFFSPAPAGPEGTFVFRQQAPTRPATDPGSPLERTGS